ncbi:MAG: tetratricopeptide repeat protein [Candidatus Limnocylindria bacterium]
MRATQDFNYKVALASGLKSLQAGRLRQAEEQFRYLVEKFPGLPGGHRGLAKVLLELEDGAAAFAILRDGGTALAKAGDRDGGIALFREAVGMEPRDTTTHRRFAAALSLAGDVDGAAAEVERYVEAQSGPGGDAARARLEAAYALERFGDHPRLVALAARFGPSAAIAPVTHAPEYDELDAAALDELAAQLLASRDPRAHQAALVAARRHLAAGRTNAAVDLLLQLIPSGIGGNEAQSALVDVVRAIGKPDIARAKCALLAQVLRLEGREDLAGDVERLGEAV